MVAAVACPLLAPEAPGQTVQWSQLPGPSSAFIKTLAVARDTMLYAGTWRGGVYESSLHDTVWRPINTGLFSSNVHTLAVDTAGTLYAGTIGKGVLRFNAQSRRWRVCPIGLTSNSIEALAVDSGNTLLAATTDAGLFKSTNCGNAWTLISSGFATLYVMSVMISREGIYFAGTAGAGVYRSIDSGATWSHEVSGLSDLYVRSIVQDTSGMLWAATGSGAFHSTDLGVSWSAANGGLTDRNLTALHRTRNGQLYAATAHGLFRRDTVNGMATWSQQGNVGCEAVASAGDSAMMVGTFGQGLYMQEGPSASFVSRSSGFRNSFAKSILLTPERKLVASLIGAGVFLSSDSGVHWSDFGAGLQGATVEVLCRNAAGTLFAGTTSSGVFRRAGDAMQWTPVGLLSTPAVLSLSWHEDTLVAGTIDGLFRSTDEGDSWTDVTGDLSVTRVDAIMRSAGRTFIGTATGVYIGSAASGQWTRTLPSDPLSAGKQVNALYVMGDGTVVAGTNSGLFVSADSGATWSDRSAGLTDLQVLSLTSDSTMLIAGLWKDGVARSNDKGITWTLAGGGLESRSVWSIVTDIDHRLYAGTYGDGIFRSIRSDLLPVTLTSFQATATGSTVRLAWVTMSEVNAASFEVSRRRVDPDGGETEWHVLASVPAAGSSATIRTYSFVDPAVSNGRYAYRVQVIERDGSVSFSTATEVDLQFIPKRTTLHQNFPNPFNPVTRISFDISRAGAYRLEVFDILGRSVRVLLDGWMSEGGHECSFDARGLSSGVYWYSLTGPGPALTRRMTLLR